MEVYQMLPEGTFAEVIDGYLYVSPAPTPKHQIIVGDIYEQISAYPGRIRSDEQLSLLVMCSLMNIQRCPTRYHFHHISKPVDSERRRDTWSSRSFS